MNTSGRNITFNLLCTTMLLGISQMAVGQCTPGFLGRENVGYVLCSPTAQIDYVNLFQVNASYNPILLPPNDTIKRAGQPDTIVTNQIKYMVIATLANGCKDTAIIRIPFNRDPYPNLGRDTSFIICRGATKDISKLYNPAPFAGIWSLPNPSIADTGRHYIHVLTRDGCRDSAFITITNFPYISLGRDTVVARSPGQTVDLYKLFDTAKLTLTWNTPTPAAAPIGFYYVIGLDSNGCRDTATAEVCKRPNMGADATIKVCPGLTTNLYGVFDLAGLLPEFNTFTPSAVGVGVYRLIVTNYCGGKDTVNINVVPGTKPNIGPDREQIICENEFTNLETLYPFTGLIPKWSLATPAQAPPGIHRLIVKNTDGCTDTTFITVTALPRKPWYNDTTVYVCGAQTKNLNLVYPFTEETLYEWVNIADETNAPEGVYTLNITEDGCTYILKVTVASEATRNASITLCTYSSILSNAPFTTNAFRSIIVDKQGNIWAGADGNGTTGGLYKFTPTGSECNQGGWSASDKFTTSSYRDLHLSPIANDNDIWCASNGHSLSEAISGGVYRISSLLNVTRFGSVLDAGDGTLSSRLANSLAIAPNNKLYVGLAVSQTGAGVIGEGDVYETNLTSNPGTFIRTDLTPKNVGERRVSAVGMRGNELWASFQRSCINGTCVDPYIQRWNTVTNSSAGTITQNNSPLLFTDNSSLIVRAIFTSSEGRTFIGLNTGAGFAVAEPADPGQSPVWTLLTDQNSAFPKGAAINFNAITEVNGEIWMGTTLGILVYDGVGPLTECKSYTLYNTTNGLASNNVTDIAYDLNRQEVWITSSAGVSKITKSFSVSGRVRNVFFGKYEKDLLPKMFTRPIKDATVTIFNGSGTRVDSVMTNENGEFNLKNSVAGQVYKVRIKYKTYTYEYSNVLPNSFIGDVLIPDSLIQDITSLKAVIKEKEVAYTFPGEQQFSLIWKIPTFKITGFDTTNFEKAFEAFSQVVVDKHKERVENLALYYLTISTINDIGKNANDLVEKAVSQSIEVVTGLTELAGSFKELGDFQALWKQGGTNLNTSAGLREIFEEDISKLIDEGKTEVFELLRDKTFEMLDEDLRNKIGGDGKPLLDTSGKLVYDAIKLIINQVADQLLLAVEDEEGVANLSVDDFKGQIVKYAQAYLVKLLSGLYYKYYCQVKHDELVPKLAAYTRDVFSAKSYNEVYQEIYDKGFGATTGINPSINKQAQDITEDANDQIETELAVAGSAKTWSDITKTASKLAVSSVALAELAPVLRVFSVVLESANLGLQGVAMATAMYNGIKVGNLSDGVVSKTGFPAIKGNVKLLNEICSPVSTTLLEASAKKYQEKLNDYSILIRGNFDTTLLFPNRYRALLKADSVYSDQLNIVLNQIRARYKNAMLLVPGFEGNMETFFSSMMDKQTGARTAMLIENISYLLAPNKAPIAPRLDSLIQSVKANNYAIISFLNRIVKSLNEYCVPSGAYLVKTGYNLSTNFAPGGTGNFSYSFTNFGSVAQNQVSFKVTPPTNGFAITGSDSIFIGTINPGQSVTVNYAYSAPAVDTVGEFTLLVKAANGFYQNQPGVLLTQKLSDNSAPISIKAGNWNDPTTWSTNQVPTAISAVIVRHNVVVNVDATCKSLKAESPGQVQLAAGKTLTVLQ